jgi:hypothetical protein
VAAAPGTAIRPIPHRPNRFCYRFHVPYVTPWGYFCQRRLIIS